MVDSTASPTANTVGEASVAPAVDRPAWLPAGFSTPEDFAKSAADTKAAYTKATQELAELKKTKEAPATDKPPEPPKEPVTPEGEKLKIDDAPAEPETKPAADAEFIAKLDPYRNEFATTGDVAPENRDAIAEMLRDKFGDAARAVVDDYIEGSKQRVKTTTEQLQAVAGGSESYAQMVTWAKDSLSTAEKEAYNRATSSGDFAAAELAISGLHAKWTKAVGKSPQLLQGDGVPNTSSGYTSRVEMMKDMQDPRYKSDPAFRDKVRAKLAMTNG